jgi:hypothetical protein
MQSTGSVVAGARRLAQQKGHGRIVALKFASHLLRDGPLSKRNRTVDTPRRAASVASSLPVHVPGTCKYLIRHVLDLLLVVDAKMKSI